MAKGKSKDEPMSSKAEAFIDFVHANNLDRNGDRQGALREYLRSLSKDPSNDRCREEIAKIYFSQSTEFLNNDEYESSMKALEQCREANKKIRRSPFGIAELNVRDRDICIIWAASKRRRGNEEAAIAILNDAFDRTGFIEILERLSEIEYEERMDEQALVHHRALASNNALNPVTRTRFVNLLIRSSVNAEKNKASSLVEEALKADPSSIDARMRSARLRIKSNDILGAIGDVRLAESMSGGEDAQALLMLGFLHYHVGNLDEAESAFTTITQRVNPDDAPSYYGLGLIAEKRGNLSGADSLYDRSIEMGFFNKRLAEGYKSVFPSKRYEEVERKSTKVELFERQSPIKKSTSGNWSIWDYMGGWER